jgi:hypothetical protein
MKKHIMLLALAGTMVGCASATSRNGTGLIYTDVTDSVTATNAEGASKIGTSCAMNILSLVSTGDMSIETAKKSASIRKVASVDYTANSILGVYNKTCVVVRGE